MPELTGNNNMSGGSTTSLGNMGSMGTGSYGTGTSMGTGVSNMGTFGSGTNTSVNTGGQTSEPKKQDFAYTGLNADEIALVNRKAQEKLQQSGQTGDVAEFAELTKAYNSYLKYKQKNERIDNSIAQTKALIDASYRINDPEVNKEYNSTSRISALGTAIKLYGDSKGKNYTEYADEDLILNLVKNTGKSQLINQYIGGKISLPDLLKQVGMTEQAQVEQDRINQENVVKEQMRNVDSKTERMIKSFFGEPVRLIGEGAKDFLDKLGVSLGIMSAEDNSFYKYLEDKYETSNLNTIPQEIKDIEREEFNKMDEEAKLKYNHGMGDGITEFGMGLGDAYFKLKAPIIMAGMTALEGTDLGEGIGTVANAIGYLTSWLNPFYMFGQLSDDVADEWRSFAGGLTVAKMLNAKKSGELKGSDGKLSYEKVLDWTKNNLNPVEIMDRFAERYEGGLRETLKGMASALEEKGFSGVGEYLKNRGAEIGKEAKEIVYDNTIKPINQAVDNTIATGKELLGKSAKIGAKWLIDRALGKKGNAMLDKLKDYTVEKFENNPELMEEVKKGVEAGDISAGQVIESQIPFSKKFATKFEQTTGKKVGDYLNDEGLYGGEDISKTVEKVEGRFKEQLEHLDEAFERIEGEFYDPVFAEMAKEVAVDAQKSYSMTSGMPNHYMNLFRKSITKGLTPKEIREIKQYYERNNKLDYQKLGQQGNGQKLRKSIDIDSRVRQKMYEILEEEYDFSEAPQIAKEIQASKMILDELLGEELGKYGDFAGLNIADIITLSNGNLGAYLLKEVVSELGSDSSKARYVDIINKATNHEIKGPTKGDFSKIDWNNLRKKIDSAVSEDMAKEKLEDKGANTYEGINSVLFGNEELLSREPGFANHMNEDNYLTTATKQGGIYGSDTMYKSQPLAEQDPQLRNISQELQNEIDIGGDNIIEIINSPAYKNIKAKSDAVKRARSIQSRFFQQGGLFDNSTGK